MYTANTTMKIMTAPFHVHFSRPLSTDMLPLQARLGLRLYLLYDEKER
jgi:hypothetical protein